MPAGERERRRAILFSFRGYMSILRRVQMKTGILTIAAAAFIIGMSGPALADGDADAGKAKAKACASCHGANGEGKKKNPPLAGMDQAKFVKAMQDYASGARDNKTMARTAKKLSEADIANLAAYYSSLK